MTAQEIMHTIMAEIKKCKFPTGNTFVIVVDEIEPLKEWLGLWDKISPNCFNIVGNTIYIFDKSVKIYSL